MNAKSKVNHPIIWIVLVASVMLVAFGALFLKTSADRRTQHDFDIRCRHIQEGITERLYDHARILRSGSAFINASENVTREEWRIYSKTQRIEQRLPGIQGVGFSLLIPRAELETHIQKIRSEGFPDYIVKPSGDREVYTSIIYLEPFDARNQRDFGYDMFSESVRRAAMERSRDDDEATLSDKVVLVQEDGKDVQAGVLMYVPVYRKGLPTETVEQRRASIFGWVYSPYRMNDLMQKIIDKFDLNEEPKLHLAVYDGANLAPQSLLFSSDPAADTTRIDDAGFHKQLDVDFNSCRWTLCFTQHGGGLFSAPYVPVWLLLFGGTLVSGMLILLILSLLNTRENARKMAQDLTFSLRESEEKHRLLFENAGDAIFIHDLTSRILEVNPQATVQVGYTREELMSMVVSQVDSYSERQLIPERIAKLLEKGHLTFETVFQHKDGSLIPHEVNARRMIWNGQLAFMSICRDISTRKRLEAVIAQRVLALTLPLDQPENISFEQLFDLATIQRIQDEFAAAMGVASIITQPDGTPITQPSNFCRLCQDLIRCTELGRHNCNHSDALIGRHHLEGPLIQHCLSGGLWDAGASITVGNRHLANWLIGQVRDETQGEEQMADYARTIGADEMAVREAFREVPVMSQAKFQQIAQALFTLANQLSTSAYQNFQQARFISERQEAEAALNSALEEKSQLVKEIHHRVKNNLAIMISLINMQARQIQHPEVLTALSDTKARLLSMSLLHEMLYRTGSMDQVEVNCYLELLCDRLTQSLGMLAQGIQIQFRPSAAMMLGINQAVPCGLIVSELVSNAIKHAFPDLRKGTIIMELVVESQDSIILCVSDDGIGLPEHMQIEQVRSVGLTLVKALARQLGGAMTIQREYGTRFEIRFPIVPIIHS